ncbi:hypothetical protein BAUCODRAFT_484509 [Baudoinia panamericana UAMH 10762]|uniref:DUF7514 domain-containing protein n=1 Tax=Baudoinia panamericana (strain UAMH 10762) TaxID=717646 RepID=M2NCM0_BAUPA|nr:uncharacterized protein BAUCODRAFT_484509 [Baudoinia panamericana UAMH 10762]EMC96645.1 hypothetical protein BAUCODRAFT_484509 [Baudoinia panamericana UAMH 10762]
MSIDKNEMDRSPSPPLPPDPTMRAKAQQPQQHPALPPPDNRRPNTSRSRANSRAAPVLQHPLPVRDAVHDAFDQSTVVQNQLDPELVRQVTEQVTAQVIRNLQTAHFGAATPTASVQPQQKHVAPQPQPQPAALPQSPTLSLSDSIQPRQYTPPSPSKASTTASNLHRSSSPEPEQKPEPVSSDASSTFSRDSARRHPRRPDATASRRGDHGSDDERPPRRDSGSNYSPKHDSPSYRRDSKSSESDYGPTSHPRTRPPRVPSDVPETTSLEKAWQPLFDGGNPTVRLSQFLRGLAMHLVDDYEPKGSLVVTPAKMLRFFNEARAEDEFYPWDTIFGGKMSHRSLSIVYQKLRCQQHLVQTAHHELPSVPALTPAGFECFMTCLIQAHPDNEYERLARAVMNMPISNADNKSERFPKELSRRLLPLQGNLHAEQRLIASFNHEPLIVQLKGAAQMPPPPATSGPPRRGSFVERERKPYAQSSFSNAIDDDDLGPPSVTFERERKPYTAKEGTGKVHERESERENGRPSTSHFKPAPDQQPPPNIRSSRSSAGVPTQATYSSSNGTEPVSIPATRSHRQSNAQGPPPAMLNHMNGGINGSVPKGRRTPPPRSPYVQSEPTNLNGIPPSQYASNLYTSFGANNPRDHFMLDPEEDSPRRNHHRRGTDRAGANGASNDDDTSGGRGYPIPPRPPPSTQTYQDSGFGPPMGSYPRQNGLSSADRRSTWYGPNGSAGTDGYGSFQNGGSGYPGQSTYGMSSQH